MYKVIYHQMTLEDQHKCFAHLKSYVKHLEKSRNHNSKPVLYGGFSIHETKTGTIVVKKVKLS